MPALREFSRVLLYHLKPHASLSQLLFLRTMTSKVFVKGLAFSTTEEELAKAFSQYGSVVMILHGRVIYVDAQLPNKQKK